MSWIELTIDYFINRPLVLMLLMAIPLALISYLGQRYPTRRLFWLLGIPTLISLFILQVPQLGWYLVVLDIAILAIAMYDLFTIVGANFANEYSKNEKKKAKKVKFEPCIKFYIKCYSS